MNPTTSQPMAQPMTLPIQQPVAQPPLTDTHWRCLSHKRPYDHAQVHANLSSEANSAHAYYQSDWIELELAFHVLSPIPGLERATDDQIINHLHSIVDCINADYAGRAYNFDSARCSHPLFKQSSMLRQYSRQHGHLPARVSGITISNKGNAYQSKDDMWLDDHVWVYQQYLKLGCNTGIRFLHTGIKDHIQINLGIAEQLKQIKLSDPDFGTKIAKLVKEGKGSGQNSLGSAASPNCLNIWIVELPYSLLGYSTFPWDSRTEIRRRLCVQLRGRYALYGARRCRLSALQSIPHVYPRTSPQPGSAAHL